MSDLEDTNELPRDEQSPRPFPEIHGGISREERGRKFEEWVNHRSIPEEKHLIDGNRLFYSEQHVSDPSSAKRVYHELHRDGPNVWFTETATATFQDGDEPVHISNGFWGREGKQSFILRTDNGAEIHSGDPRTKTWIQIRYTPAGLIDYASISDYEAGFIMGGEPIYFDSKGNSNRNRTKTSGNSGSPRIVEDKSFINLIKDENGEVTIYPVPRVVNVEDCTRKLVPQSLQDNPFSTPTTEDKWYRADFLEAFGINKKGINQEDLPPQSNDDSQGQHR